jgi:misacylated tRNA(Ala) deacylase
LFSLECLLLMYPGDPLLRELRTKVVSSTISQPPPPPKRSKKGSAPQPNDPVLEVILYDTVIFPEGGGQPSDIGCLTVMPNEQTYEVIQVKRTGGHAIHYVRIKDAENDMLALSPGAEVTVNLGQEGFDRRYDHVSDDPRTYRLAAQIPRLMTDDIAHIPTSPLCAA